MCVLHTELLARLLHKGLATAALASVSFVDREERSRRGQCVRQQLARDNRDDRRRQRCGAAQQRRWQCAAAAVAVRLPTAQRSPAHCSMND